MGHLSNRQRELLQLLGSTKMPLTGLELADLLGVSLRTVQGDIKKINDSDHLITSSYDGYRLSCAVDLDDAIASENSLEGRVEEQDLLKFITDQSGRVTVDDLSERFYLSASSVERKLRQARKQVQAFDLSIAKHQGKIHLEGSEANKRRLISALIADEVNFSFSDLEDIEAWIGNLDLSRVRTAMNQAVEECGARIKRGYENTVLTNLGIAVYRMRNGSYIRDYPAVVRESRAEITMAERFCKLYSEHHRITPGDADIAYLGSLLLGQIVLLDRPSTEAGVANLIESSDFSKRVQGIVNDVFDSFLLHADSSQALFTFAMHVNALIERCHGFQYEQTETLENIKMNCPFVYELSVLISKRLEIEFDLSISEGELGFICIHVGMLIESLMTEDRARIALECDDYRGLAKRLRDQIERRFSDVAIVLAHDDAARAIDEHEIDLIVSTRRMSGYDSRVVVISPFCTPSDFLKIESALGLWHSNNQASKTERLLRPFFDERLFYLGEKCPHFDDREQVITFLSGRMRALDYVQDDFCKSVLQREHLSSTCFFDLFAVPHSIEMNSKRTIASILIDPKGIPWGEGRAKIVILIAVCKEDRQRFMEIYNTLVKSLCNEIKASKMSRAQSLEEFLELISI